MGISSVLAVSSALGRSFGLDVAKGAVADGFVSKFGRNPQIDTTTDPEDIWDGGGIWAAPTAARIHNLASTGAQDDVGGTGALTVSLMGLLDDWSLSGETVTMTGAVDAPTSQAYRRIFRMWVASAGTQGVNDGNITATAVGDATVTAQITGDAVDARSAGQSLMAIYTVPLGVTGYLFDWYGTLNRATPAAASADLRLLSRDNGLVAPALRTRHHLGLAAGGSSHFFHPFPVPLVFTEKTDLIVRCTEVSASATDISAGFDLVLVNN